MDLIEVSLRYFLDCKVSYRCHADAGHLLSHLKINIAAISVLSYAYFG
jgi:hypothetical protein